MHNTPIAEQLRIVICGLRNAGKSTLMNNLFEKEISIVSHHPGTTTDPVVRSIEMGKLGPVAVVDTAGFDDEGELGTLRVKKTEGNLTIADILLFVTRGDQPPSEREIAFLRENRYKGQVIAALTCTDLARDEQKMEFLSGIEYIPVNNMTGEGIKHLKERLISAGLAASGEITPVEGLVRENELIILVTPIDLAAPKGRLILPQVETIRDLLDKDCQVMIVKERELKNAYDNLKNRPALVICDSQVFSKVAADIDDDVPLTSFSILFARKKGDLGFYVESLRRIIDERPGGRVLVLESCSHHRQADDIGTVKIPRLYRQLVSPDAVFESSREIPGDIGSYSLVINCAGCMVSRNEMVSRIGIFRSHGIPVINYGLFLAHVNGLLPRALEMFPHEYEIYNR